jgi:integrase
VYLPTTKNGDPRTVPLSSKAVAILDAVPRTDKKVFPKVSYEAFSGVWRRACERAGVEDFHYHDLRHMAITRMSKLLPNVIELSRVSGHRNLRNLDRYYHTTPEQLAAKLG